MKNQNISQKKPSLKKYIILAVIIPLLIITAMVFIFFSQELKSDPASEAIIRQIAAVKLNTDPNNPIDPNTLTSEDFAQIKELTLSHTPYLAAKLLNKEPNDLTKEDTFKILTYTVEHMDSNNISAVMSPIYLELSDIKLLKKLKNLQTLTIGAVRLPEKNIPTWMKILAKYGIYDLSERYNIDLSPLKNLTSLNTLNLEDSHVKNIEPLSKLINLKELNLNDTSVSDLKPIKKLTNLENLMLRSTDVSDLGPIRGLTKLQSLELSRAKNVTNIKPLRGLICESLISMGHS